MSPEDARRIAENVAAVKQRIAAAATRSGRNPTDVCLVAVTKYVDAETTRAVFEAGCHDLGESRPQQLLGKAEALADSNPAWHLVGQLQRNKVARTLPLVTLIHSMDSVKLARAIEREAAKLERTVDVLLEVNISGDSAKHGFSPEQVEPALPSLAELSYVRVKGLMTMAHREGGVDIAERDFAALRQLRDRLSKVCPQNVSLTQLSMGMSGDYEAAITEGATIVRIGSSLFEGLER